MSETGKAETRPAQVTVASWLIMVGSVFVVLTVWDRITGLRSMEAQQSLRDVLGQPLAKAFGLDLNGLRTLVTTLSMIAAGCATAMAVLGFQTLQPNRTARIALTVLAVPLFLTGLVLTGLSTGDFLSSVVAAAVGTLWLRPGGAWFSGRPTQPSPTTNTGPAAPAKEGPRVPRPEASPPEPHSSQPPTGPSYPPPASSPFGEAAPSAPPRTPYGASAPSAPAQPTPYHQGPFAVPRDPASPRPDAALWACLLTWLCCSLATLVLLGSIALLASDTTTVLDKLHEQNPDLATQGVSDHLILTVCFVMCGAFVVWAIAAAVAAVLVFRRVRWAWWALVISTAATIGLCALGLLGSLVMVVPLAAAGATISMLLRPEVRRWLA